MKNIIKRIGLSIFGIFQGTIGFYLALLGLAFAIPESAPGSKDYEEDLFVAPFGYIIILIYLVVMVATFISLRKNKANLLSFLIPWLICLSVFLIIGFYYFASELMDSLILTFIRYMF